MVSLAVFLSVLAFMSGVESHGGAISYIIDGVEHVGNMPWVNNGEPSIQRGWRYDYIVDRLDDKYMTCGNPGRIDPNMYYAPIAAGNNVTANIFFAHPYGPMTAYMAACPEDGCENVDIHAPIWFKIWERGLISGTWRHGTWILSDLVYPGKPIDIPIPASLKPGKYLFRSEMLNLETGPAQWFATCSNLEVSGSGDSLPATEQLVAIPGVYDKDLETSFILASSYPENASTWFYKIHANDTEYQIPGPAVWEG